MSDQSGEFEELGKDILGDVEKELDEAIQGELPGMPEEPVSAAEPSEPEEEEEHTIPLSEREDMTPEEAEELKEQEVERLLQVLSRGIVNDNLANILEAAVPEGHRGKFVRDDRGSITRYQNFGYDFNYREEALGMHGTGDSRIRVGDVVLMTITERRYQILQEVRRRQIDKKLGAGRREYKRLEAQAKERGQQPAQSFDNSETVLRRETV